MADQAPILRGKQTGTRLEGAIKVCDYCGFAMIVAGPRECCRSGKDVDQLEAENARLRAALTAITAYTGRVDAAHRLALIAEEALSHTQQRNEQ